jgi:hypothetical protein
MSNTDGPEPPFVGDAKCLKNSDDGHTTKAPSMRSNTSYYNECEVPQNRGTGEQATPMWTDTCHAGGLEIVTDEFQDAIKSNLQ